MSLKNCCGDAGAGPGVHVAGNLFAAPFRHRAHAAGVHDRRTVVHEQRHGLVMSYAPCCDEARRGRTSSSNRVRGVLPASVVF